LELDKQTIVRADFSSVRRGYDQEEVDRHLREVAQAVEALKRESEKAAEGASAGSLGSTAADQVRAIVEAAERSASEIEAAATEQADRVTGEATRQAEEERSSARGEADRVRREAEEAARETRERAEAEAAQHVAGVEEATASMRSRADTVETDLSGLVDQLRTQIEEIVQSVRSNAGSLEAELSNIRASLAEVHEARPEVEPGLEPVAESDPAAPVEEADEPTRERHPDADFEEAAAEDDAAYVEPIEDDELDLDEDEALAAEPEEVVADAPASGESADGARLIALNMALNGTPRDETARYLEENFDLEDPDTILDEVYARVGG
jgi:DivIVA domain-containing protein